VVIHYEEALYQVYVPLHLPLPFGGGNNEMLTAVIYGFFSSVPGAAKKANPQKYWLFSQQPLGVSE